MKTIWKWLRVPVYGAIGMAGLVLSTKGIVTFLTIIGDTFGINGPGVFLLVMLTLGLGFIITSIIDGISQGKITISTE